MAITVELLLAVAARSPDSARVGLLRTPNPGQLTDLTGVVCWCQEVVPDGATPAQRTAIRTRLIAAVTAATTARVWISPITVEEERDELGRRLWTIYVFKAT